jgi:hypothetical protein
MFVLHPVAQGFHGEVLSTVVAMVEHTAAQHGSVEADTTENAFHGGNSSGSTHGGECGENLSLLANCWVELGDNAMEDYIVIKANLGLRKS